MATENFNPQFAGQSKAENRQNTQSPVPENNSGKGFKFDRRGLYDFQFPDSLSFEADVICDIVAFPDSILEARKTLTRNDFSDVCGRIWNEICRMDDEGITPDLMNISRRISKDDFNSVILANMGERGCGINVSEHIYLLKETSIKRQAYFTAIELLKKTVSPSSRVDEITKMASGLVDSVANETKSKRTQKINEAINNLSENLQSEDRRIPTGIQSIDKLTYGGFNEGNLVILAARPSVGKTATALYMMMQAARSGKKVFMASLEMTNTELAQRYMFSTEYVKPVEFATKNVNWNNFEKAANIFSDLNIYINDEVKTIDEIVSEIKAQVKLNGIEIAYVDYLGLIRGNGPVNEPLCMALGRITGRLKELAKELHIPIVLLCQLNRSSATEKRTPQLYDLRDSGSIEQDADIVLMLHKPDGRERNIDVTEVNEDGTTSGDNRLDIWVRKNRNGKRDIAVVLEHNATHTLYSEAGIIAE